MKTPKAYSEALIDWIRVWGCFGLPVGSQLKLTEGIEYVLNPAAGFKPNPEIELAWRIVYPDGTSVQNPLIPRSCFSEYTFSSSALIYPDVNVYVKVFANLEREDADGNTQNVLWVSKYLVELQRGTLPTDFFYSGAGVISPNTTSIEFTQTNPTVIGIFSGNNAYAWKDMTISVEMIAQSFPFVLGAGGEINLEPGASPQQTLSVSHLLLGVYICHIQTKQGYHTKRFVKD